MTKRTGGAVVVVKRKSGASGWGKKNEDRKKASEARQILIEEQITAEIIKSLQRRSTPVHMFWFAAQATFSCGATVWNVSIPFRNSTRPRLQ